MELTKDEIEKKLNDIDSNLRELLEVKDKVARQDKILETRNIVQEIITGLLQVQIKPRLKE